VRARDGRAAHDDARAHSSACTRRSRARDDRGASSSSRARRRSRAPPAVRDRVTAWVDENEFPTPRGSMKPNFPCSVGDDRSRDARGDVDRRDRPRGSMKPNSRCPVGRCTRISHAPWVMIDRAPTRANDVDRSVVAQGFMRTRTRTRRRDATRDGACASPVRRRRGCSWRGVDAV